LPRAESVTRESFEDKTNGGWTGYKIGGYHFYSSSNAFKGIKQDYCFASDGHASGSNDADPFIHVTSFSGKTSVTTSGTTFWGNLARTLFKVRQTSDAIDAEVNKKHKGKGVMVDNRGNVITKLELKQGAFGIDSAINYQSMIDTLYQRDEQNNILDRYVRERDEDFQSTFFLDR